MRTVLPPKIKDVLRFVKHKSDTYFYGGWIFIPSFLSHDFAEFRLNIIRDYIYFRKAEQMGLIRMQYNESGAILTLQGRKALEDM